MPKIPNPIAPAGYRWLVVGKDTVVSDDSYYVERTGEWIETGSTGVPCNLHCAFVRKVRKNKKREAKP